MADTSDGSVSTKNSTCYNSPRNRRDLWRRIKRSQISHNSRITGCDVETTFYQSALATMPRSPKPKEYEEKESESSVGSQSTLSTKASISPRQQQMVQMLRTKSASRRTPLAPQPKLHAAQSSSSSARPPIYPALKSKAKEVDKTIPERQRNGGTSQSSTSSASLERQHSPSISAPQRITRLHQPKQESTVRTAFHIRLSIGYMTGLKMEKVAKWTRIPNHGLVVGFVELASSGKYTALSQPLLPNAGEGKSQTTKILWANPKSGKDASKSRRRLHFSLQLDRKRWPSADDDDSFGSQASYIPEVVKLLVGLKCGNERLPLGIAKFIISGRETVEQKMDLTVQQEPGLYITKRGIFGKKQQRNFFTHGDHAYKIAPNAKLRVKADIKIGFPGQDGAAIWASGNDDSSYVTNWTYDVSTMTQSAPKMHDPERIQTMTSATSQIVPAVSYSRAHIEQNANGITYHIPSNEKSLKCRSESTETNTSNEQPTRVHQAPVQFVSLRSPTDLMSFTSGLTAPEPGCDGFWFHKSCMPFLCGDDPETLNGRDRYVAKSFSFESSEKSRMHGTIPKSISGSTTSSTDESSCIVGEPLQGTLVQINKGLHSKPCGPISDTRAMADDEVETLDVTEETYNDLKDAQATLMRYASKVGVDMGDLLDGKQSFRRQ